MHVCVCVTRRTAAESWHATDVRITQRRHESQTTAFEHSTWEGTRSEKEWHWHFTRKNTSTPIVREVDQLPRAPRRCVLPTLFFLRTVLELASTPPIVSAPPASHYFDQSSPPSAAFDALVLRPSSLTDPPHFHSATKPAVVRPYHCSSLVSRVSTPDHLLLPSPWSPRRISRLWGPTS